MKRLLSPAPLAVACTVAFGGMGCGDSTMPPASATGPWFITDELGRAIIFHGINVSGSAKDAPDRLPDVTEREIAHMADAWGMNFARYLTLWDALEPQEGQYNDAYLTAVRA